MEVILYIVTLCYEWQIPLSSASFTTTLGLTLGVEPIFSFAKPKKRKVTPQNVLSYLSQRT